MEENRDDLTPVPQPAPQEPAPQPEPDEVVSWYVRPDDGVEVTDCYVQPRPMPAAAVPKQPQEKVSHSRKGLWIFLVAMAVLVGVVLGAAIVSALRSDGSDGDYNYDGGDHDASSIVDIFGNEKPAIPRADPDPDLRFYCENASGDKLTIQQVYAAVNPATVLVVAEMGEKASIGTGVILTADGYMVTNAHVIAGGKSAFVVLADGSSYDAELVGYDSGEDLAVLKAVDAHDLSTAPLGNSDACQVGDTVYAIGNPLGVELRGTLTEGIISAIDRQVTLDGRVMTLLQTTAALNNGNSGGPLINEYGQVVGINTMKMSRTAADTESATVEGLGFAVPSGKVAAVINDIVATGTFHGLPSIGVYVMETEQPDGTVHPVVDSVSPGYGAEAAGLLPGDVILAADGVPVYANEDLLAARRTHIVGENIILTVRRGDHTFEADVYLYPMED